MTWIDQEHALEVARRVVGESTADETEVIIEALEDRFVRFADSGPTQSGDRSRLDVAVRVRFRDGSGWREAKATCGTLDPEDTRAALERAVLLARVSDANEELSPLAGACEVAPTAPERPTLDHTFREKAAMVDLALSACASDGLAPAGLIETTGMTRAIANSAGRGVTGARTRAAFSLTASNPDTAEGPGGAGFAEGVAANVERIDPERVVRRATQKAVGNRHPRPVEPGEYTVVLEPSAVSSMVLFGAYHGFGAQEVAEKNSFLCGRTGETLFPTSLRLEDDVYNERYPGIPFDGEGHPKRTVPLLADGQLVGPVTDARWARKLSIPNTGHGVAQPSTEGPSPTSLFLHPGTASLEELIKGVDRGLLVTQFHYTNMIEPLELTLTGMTRNGTYWIENGEVQHPVRNLRFTQTLVGALQNVSGVGRELEVAGALFDGEVVCPALRIDGFRFTSTTDF